MNKTIVYVVALVVVSLIAGTLLGVVLSHRQGPPGYGQVPGRFMRDKALRNDGGPVGKLSKILKLSSEQEVKLAKILEESRQEVMQIQHKAKETFVEIKKRTDAKIRSILTPQQQARFDKFESNLQKRMRGERVRSRFLDRGTDENGPMPGGVPAEEDARPEPVE